jgi:hypothetical protein
VEKAGRTAKEARGAGGVATGAGEQAWNRVDRYDAGKPTHTDTQTHAHIHTQ